MNKKIEQVWHNLKSEDSYEMDRGTVFCVSSPIDAPRDLKGYLKKLGSEVIIDGKIYKPIGIEAFALNSPVKIGEEIGLLVKEK